MKKFRDQKPIVIKPLSEDELFVKMVEMNAPMMVLETLFPKQIDAYKKWLKQKDCNHSETYEVNTDYMSMSIVCEKELRCKNCDKVLDVWVTGYWESESEK